MSARNSIDNSDDVIDSRDVMARIEHLQDCEDLDESELGELHALLNLCEACESWVSDWQYGAQLIRESYFERYAQELAEDCGMLANATQWPLTCIDWEQAARELAHDYTSVEFDGVTYLVRS